MRFISIISLLFLAAGCTGKQTFYLAGFAEGTTYRIAAAGGDTTGLRQSLNEIFAAADRSMSIYNDSSLLSRLNANLTDSLDRHIARCIGIARQVSVQSGGAYDITVLPLTEAWGFAARGRIEHPDLDSLLQFVGYEKICMDGGRLVKTDPRVRLDLNSIAKGYTADLLAAELTRRGCRDFMVEVGGEIALRGRNSRGEKWRIGIDKPSDIDSPPGRELQAILSISDCAIATSGNYRRYRTDADGNRVVHTIDPLTGLAAAGDVLSATVIAADCATADAYATMLMVVGAERAKEFLSASRQIKGYLIYSLPGNGSDIFFSPGLERYIVNLD